MIPYSRHDINQDDVKAVIEVLQSEFLTQGPKVKEFEEAFAEYVGARYGVAVSNGTVALHLCALALDVRSGDRILTTPNTFVASANCILYCGGDVDFVDINPEDLCLDPGLLEKHLEENPGRYRGIIPVDFAGHPIQMDRLKEIADRHHLWIIEDGCHAPGATFTDRNGVSQKTGNGNFADLTVFSFHPAKHITTGEGGLITTNSERLYQKLLLLRSHGITKDPQAIDHYEGGWFYEMQNLGHNGRISDILCALGLSQLKRAEQSLLNRQRIAKRYDLELKNLPLILPTIKSGSVHAFHLYVVQTKRRKELYEYLKSKEIYSQVHYIPIHKQPYYAAKYGRQTFKNSEKYYDECLSLPLFHSMSDEDQTYVITAMQEFFKEK